ncbi:TetR/AcrR family transcriptional regulator [Phyllobacterium sp. P5_D12]
MSSTPSKTIADSSDKLVTTLERPRERIVKSAIELFRQHGIKGIGVDAIAEAAGSNKMTLYRHFGCKDDLVCECLKQVSSEKERIWVDLENAYPGDPARQLRGWVDEAAQRIFNDLRGCDLVNAAVELKEAGHPAQKVIMDAKKAHMQHLVELCRRAGVQQYEQLAQALVLLVEGARVCGQSIGIEGPQQRLKQTCEALIDAFSKH